MARRSSASKSEIPFLHAKQIEAEADLLIAEYGERFEMVAAPPVPIDEIAECHLNLTLEYRDMQKLFPFADVHGAIWFREARIGIEQTLDPDSNPSRRGRYHFTLAHEVGHWRLHRPHFLTNPAERLLFPDGTPEPDVVCRSSEGKKPVEWQADAFAANLLMPRKLVQAAWIEFRGGDDEPVVIAELRTSFAESIDSGTLRYKGRAVTDQGSIDTAIKEEFCRPLADQFEVSREAMRIRLEQLELLVQRKEKSLF